MGRVKTYLHGKDGRVTNGEHVGNTWGTIGASVRLILASASDSPTQNGRVTSGGGGAIGGAHSCLRFGLSDPEPVATSGLSEEFGPQALGALDQLSKQGDGESESQIEARQLV